METIQETVKKRLESFTNLIVEVVEDRFNRDKEVTPVVFGLVQKEGKFGVAILEGLAELFSGDHGKDLAAMMMKEMAKEVKPIAIAFVCEAWATEKKISDKDDILDENGKYRPGAVRPSEDPNRKEILFINFETFDHEASQQWDIVKNEAGEKVLNVNIKAQWTKKGAQIIGGRFQDLLQENYSEMAQTLKKELENHVN